VLLRNACSLQSHSETEQNSRAHEQLLQVAAQRTETSLHRSWRSMTSSIEFGT
jgi:hypothetical protein